MTLTYSIFRCPKCGTARMSRRFRGRAKCLKCLKSFKIGLIIAEYDDIRKAIDHVKADKKWRVEKYGYERFKGGHRVMLTKNGWSDET